MPKSALKRIQTCFDCNLDIFFEKFLPSFPWKVESSKIFKKIKKVSNFLKRPKSFPKVSKRVLIVIWTIFSKNFCPVFHGGSSFRKFSKIFFSKFQKCTKSFPKVSKRVLNVFWGKFFENFVAQCSVEGRVFEIFQKKNIFKVPKMPKSIPKSIQTCFEHVLGKIF